MTKDFEDFVVTTDLKKGKHDLQFYLDGMTEEHGELAGVLKRARRGDYGEAIRELMEKNKLEIVLNDTEVRKDFLKEIGDRHWYETRLLQRINTTWSEVELINMKKLSKRLESDKIMGHGDNREDAQ